MSRAPKSVDDVLFEPLSPSALMRGERELSADRAAVRELAAGRAAVEALARGLAPAAPSDALRARLMASFAQPGKYGIFADRVARLFDLPLDKARELLARVEDPSRLKPGPAEGILWLNVRPGAKYADGFGAIGRLKPGARFPHHAHLGEETTLVIDGGFVDVTGEEVWRGDEMVKAPGSEHDFVVLDGVDCIAAVLARGGVTF